MVADTSLDYLQSRIGSRIECCGDFGTVKYIGPVEGHPGVWLGIDWDNIERGKHNGTVNGMQYFQTRHTKSGSFVRKEKVNFGQSLVDSISSRYGGVEDETTIRIKEQELLNLQKTINAPFIKLVGFDEIATKQSNFHSLQVVSVRLQNVSSIGRPCELRCICPNIVEIDLSKNLLSSWNDIFDVCSQLDNLYWLNVSENLLTFPENIDTCNHVFLKITVFICGCMNLKWDDIKKLSRIFPNVKELRAPYNSIVDLTTPVNNNFKQLELLDLEGNAIRNWSEINKLSVITSLQNLILEYTELKNIEFASDLDKIDEFSNLRKLSISHNLIAEWVSIGELNRLKNLEELKLLNNPVLETENVATRTQLIIARIENLKIFNGTEIKDGERRGAEYDYIKKYGLEWLKVTNTKEERVFLKNHNRYLDLIKKYGAPEESELIVQPNILKTSLVTLNFVHGKRKLTKSLPQSMTVQKLLMLVQKLFRLQERPGLEYVSAHKGIEVCLDDEMKEIGYYSIEDNDTIIVT